MSASVKGLLAMDVRELLKITAAGIKVFERQEDKVSEPAARRRRPGV